LKYCELQLVLKNYNSGSEIAAHTINHVDLSLSTTNAAAEIKGSFDILVAEGIPKNKVIGFRHP
jgi:hypothetical protein